MNFRSRHVNLSNNYIVWSNRIGRLMLVELFPFLLYRYIAWCNGGRWGTRSPGLRLQDSALGSINAETISNGNLSHSGNLGHNIGIYIDILIFTFEGNY